MFTIRKQTPNHVFCVEPYWLTCFLYLRVGNFGVLNTIFGPVVFFRRFYKVCNVLLHFYSPWRRAKPLIWRYLNPLYYGMLLSCYTGIDESLQTIMYWRTSPQEFHRHRTGLYVNNGQAVVLRNTSSVKHTYRNCTNYILDKYISNMTTFFTFLLESQGKSSIIYIVMIV